MARKREVEPNYPMLLQSCVCAIRCTMQDLKRAENEYNNLFGITDEGTYWIYEGYKERAEKIRALKEELVHLNYEMQEIKAKMEVEQ